MSSAQGISPSATEPQRIAQSAKICSKAKVIAICASGALLALAGLFILLAASRILPHGVNAISQLGRGGMIIGLSASSIGSLMFITSAVFVVRLCCRKEKIVHDELATFFSSSEKTQRIFDINGCQVGIIFNPGEHAIRAGFPTAHDPVRIISERELSEEIKKIISDNMPEDKTCTYVAAGYMNNQPIFSFFKFT